MDKRTGESPMDFEWQTRAPGDVTSPFYQIGAQHDKKRAHSVFDSPQKPTLPSLREPNSQPFLFSQPQQQPAPLSPKARFGQPAFQTPRKLEVDFSSGAENMSSPEYADNEDTPEQQSKPGRGTSGVFNFHGRNPQSPGRGEIPRLTHHSNAALHRIQKKRRRDKELGRKIRVDTDDDSDPDRPSSREGKPVKATKQGKGQQGEDGPSRMSTWSEFFSMLEAHPNVPAIISCRAPALETICENWERCMNRDPAKVGRAKVSAHTMAIIINSFIDPISWKAILFFLATISTVTVVSNWSFRSFRHRYQQQHYAQPPQTQPMHPQLQHNPSFGYYGQSDPRQTQAVYNEKQDQPLMLENRAMDFVTERSREREQQLRTPSPTKRRFA
ncbi:uncharacterized protein N7515_006076 [Penicillium bovifimosum]|uniref:Brl1/Brr6 domain-containing protein n=1 Tax=Penicillium bovifimosum TaxID=126998 RepID=A0A9W9L0U9_9EURO|nr:uncharacterized protein N7515_006076 [Penicillium bovifimosum]KAJ5130037.1 hypothetical protein N7515_006076 [Penicillium bovifimosum]